MAKVKIVVVGDPTLVTGLTLAGLEHSIITTKDNFQGNLEKVIKDDQYGVVVVQEDMLQQIDWRLKRKLDHIAYPVVVPVPGLSGESKEGDDLRNLIKRALGFDIMMKKD